jgi:hypothetical protein
MYCKEVIQKEAHGHIPLKKITAVKKMAKPCQDELYGTHKITVVLISRISSYRDIVQIHVQYYSKPNRARILTWGKLIFILRVLLNKAPL